MNRPVLAAAALVAVLGAACSGDDDATDSTSPVTEPAATSAPSTAPETTPPPRDPPESTTTATTEPLPTTIDEAALKAEIAADHERSWALRDELSTTPSLDGLAGNLARVAAEGSSPYVRVEALIRELVALNERVIDNDPDYSTMTVEHVELIGEAPYDEATVTFCVVSNRRRVNADGTTLPGTGNLVAVRGRESVVLTPHGWLPDGDPVALWTGLEVTTCPAS